MKNGNRMTFYQGILNRIALLGALALCAVSTPVFAQEAIGGKFTLKDSARFGGTVLAAGQYRFLIEPVGNIQSIRSIQQGAAHLVLVVVKAKNSGPSVSMFAMASPAEHEGETSELFLGSEKQEALVQSMYLEKEGLKVDFNWTAPKAKSQVVAQNAEPRPATARPGASGSF